MGLTTAEEHAHKRNGSYSGVNVRFHPAPFLIGRRLESADWQISGPFGPALRFENLEIHKVFLRFSTLILTKNPRCLPNNLLLRRRLDILSDRIDSQWIQMDITDF